MNEHVPKTGYRLPGNLRARRLKLARQPLCRLGESLKLSENRALCFSIRQKGFASSLDVPRDPFQAFQNVIEEDTIILHI